MKRKLKVNVKHYQVLSAKKNSQSEKLGVYVRVTAKRQTANFKSPEFMNYPGDLTSKSNFLDNEGRIAVDIETNSIKSFLELIAFDQNDGFSIKGLGNVYTERYFFPLSLIVDDYFKNQIKVSLEKSNLHIVIKLIDWDMHISHIEENLISLADSFSSGKLREILRNRSEKEKRFWDSLDKAGLIRYSMDNNTRVVNLNENPIYNRFYLFYEDKKVRDYLESGEKDNKLLKEIIKWNFRDSIERLTDEAFVKSNRNQYQEFLNLVINKF